MELTPEQWKAASSTASKIVIGAGEGAGKSFLSAVYATAHILWDLQRLGAKPDGRPVAELYWIVGADYIDAYREFDLIYQFNEKLGNVEAGSLHIRDEGRDKCSFRTLAGQLIETITAADPTAIGRLEPHGIVGAEVSRWNAETWTRVFGRLARQYQDGSWGIFTGSFESSVGPFADWFKVGEGPNEYGLRSFSMPTWTNYHKYPTGLDDPEIRRLMGMTDESRFIERYGGRPVPPTNAVLPMFSSARHVDEDIDYIEGEPCYLAIDPGDYVYSVLFVQIINGEVWVLDEVYANHWNHEAVIAEVKHRPGWKHAAKTRRGAIDIAGTQHHAAASPAELWEKHTGFTLGSNKVEVEKSVERLQSVLAISPVTGRARLRIHPRAKGLLSELGGGPSPVPNGGVWLRQGKGGRPKRENDHSCKALAYLLIDLFGTEMPDQYTLPDRIDFDTWEAPSYMEWSFG